MNLSHILSQRIVPSLLWPLALVFALSLYAANIWLGDLNQDEGWYLYAAQSVARFELPYRDFAFTQGPVLPVVYAFFSKLITAEGVLAGRCVTAVMGGLAALLAAVLAGQLAGKPSRLAAFVAFVLAGCNTYHTYYTSIVKTYALCSLLLVAGFLFFVWAVKKERTGFYVVSGFLLLTAAATRLSAVVFPAVFGLGLLWNVRATGWRKLIGFSAGILLGLLIWVLPFAVLAPQGVWFGLVEFHTLREAGSLLAGLVYKGGFVSRFVQGYLVLTMMLMMLILLPRRKNQAIEEHDMLSGVKRLGWLALLAGTGLHLVAPFPYEDYQAIFVPIAAALTGAAFARYVVGWRPGGLNYGEANESDGADWSWIFAGLIFVMSGLAAGSSPVVQDWFIAGRDRIWWNMKPASALSVLRAEGDYLKEGAGTNTVLLTQDTYLAVEAGLRVPAGLEMGPFSYYPEMERTKAEALHLVNREMLLELLDATDAQVAALSGYGLSIASPEVQPISDQDQLVLMDRFNARFENEKEVTPFGQAHTTLTIYRRKN